MTVTGSVVGSLLLVIKRCAAKPLSAKTWCWIEDQVINKQPPEAQLIKQFQIWHHVITQTLGFSSVHFCTGWAVSFWKPYESKRVTCHFQPGLGLKDDSGCLNGSSQQLESKQIQRWIKHVTCAYYVGSYFWGSFRISFQGKTSSWRTWGPIKFLQKSSGISPLARGIEMAWKVFVKTMWKVSFGRKKRLQVGRDWYWSGHFWLRWKSLFPWKRPLIPRTSHNQRLPVWAFTIKQLQGVSTSAQQPSELEVSLPSTLASQVAT